jgi:propanol-preferring alcohol dehydrogenase
MITLRRKTMRAMVLEKTGEPLILRCLAVPTPGPSQLLIQIRACGICRTDLHIFDGELTDPTLPLVLGHEIIGEVVATGDKVKGFSVGQQVGVPWLGGTCNHCVYCCSGRENLCDEAVFTGYRIHGGYAEYTVADSRFCFPVSDFYSPAEAAPLLCAGLIGYRSLRMAGTGKRLGLYGFGAAAHIITQVARFHGREVYAFTRPGDDQGQKFARSLGAVWAAGSDALPPEPLDAAIIFAPAGPLVPTALRGVAKGGTVVCAGIHMSEIPPFSYDLLWGERTIRSVANLTRRDGEEFLALAPQVPVQANVETFDLADANEALHRLRTGRITGAAVLVMG